MSNKCYFYLEVKDLREGDTKLFSCTCNRHRECIIQVVKVDGVIRELSQAYLKGEE